MAESKLQGKSSDSDKTTQRLESVQSGSDPLAARLSHSAAQRMQIDPSRLAARDVLALQRSIGNRAVADLLGRTGQSPAIPVIRAKFMGEPAAGATETDPHSNPPLAATQPRIQRNEESAKMLTELATPKVFDGPEIKLQQGIVKSLEENIVKDEKLSSKPLLYIGSVEIVKPLGEDFVPILENAKLVDYEDNALGTNFNGYELAMAAGQEKSIIFNTLKTMQAAGQLDYIRESELVNDEWKLVIEIHYYRDRQKQSNNFHKDTLGQTLFVNLNYNTSEEIVGPEFIVNPPVVEAHDLQIAATLPPVFLADLEQVRNRVPEADTIQTAMIPAFGVVAFVDEAIHHMTPLVGHRLTRPDTIEDTLTKLYKGDYDRAKSAYEKYNSRWLDYTYESYLDKDLQKDADMWYQLIQMTEAEDSARYGRPDFEKAGVPEPMINDFLAISRNSGFNTVSIPDRKVKDLPRPNDGRSIIEPVDSRKKRLTRQMSFLAKKGKLPGESSEKRSFFRTWVRAVRK